MISHFFIDRPIFATVLSIVIVILGVVAVSQLPIAQYPDVTPPTVQVTATYPGANAVTVAETVATPIEQEVNGVERMLYMSSKCTNDGQMNLDVTFELGTDLDTAQVLVQNRVAVAEAKLPEEVKRTGVTTKKKSPSILMCVNLISPDGRYDQLYLSNFALLNVKDDLARVKGVGDVTFLGPRDYSMRVWLDPNKLASLDMTASDVIQAIKEQNVQVAAGRIGQPPVPPGANVPFQLPINVQGRLSSEEQFEDIVVKRGEDGQVVHLRDVVREKTYDEDGRVVEKGIELGAKNYDVNSYLDGEPSVTLAVFQLPGSNALDTAAAIREKMAELKSRFPEGVEYRIEYDTTVFVSESITSVYHTLIEAFVLVFIVVLVFLQNWRATIIPMVAVPVSLVGTFAVMAVVRLFAQQSLAVRPGAGDRHRGGRRDRGGGERRALMATGLSPRDAARKAMDEVTGPVIAISLVLLSRVRTDGLHGRHQRPVLQAVRPDDRRFDGDFGVQFADAQPGSPVHCCSSRTVTGEGRRHGGGGNARRCRVGDRDHRRLARLCVPRGAGRSLDGTGVHAAEGHGGHGPTRRCGCGWRCLRSARSPAGLLSRPVNWVLNRFFDGFNWVFDVTIKGYGWCVGLLLRTCVIVLVVYGGLMFLTYRRLSGRADRIHPGTGWTKGIWSSTPSFPTEPIWIAATRWCGSSARFGPRDRRRRAHDRSRRLLDDSQHEHLERGRHVRHPVAL